MKALKRLTLAFAVLAFGGVGCGDDDDNNNNNDNNGGDGGKGGSPDASIDSSTPDSSRGDAGYACTPSTRPMGAMCGGNNCELTAAQLKTRVTTNSACKKDVEVEQYCTHASVDVVQTCILQNLTKPDRVAATKTCAAAMLTEYSGECLDCFVVSADCAARECLAECGADPASPACDTCRIDKGCIPNFYTCAGIDSPIPGM